jgi:hypothetical protein
MALSWKRTASEGATSLGVRPAASRALQPPPASNRQRAASTLAVFAA